MNNQEALVYIQTYFDELFVKRNLDAIDLYMDRDYFDDDIGDPGIDHVQSSKEYLADLFKNEPTIGVDVKDAVTRDNVISAFVEWFVREHNNKRVIRRGLVIFVLNGQKILKRHTYIYFSAPGL